jgi:ribosome-binding protein aMBF1 (putative translation factor)
MKARQAKGWTQAEVAQKMNVKASIITDYESGKAIPNPQVGDFGSNQELELEHHSHSCFFLCIH